MASLSQPEGTLNIKSFLKYENNYKVLYSKHFYMEQQIFIQPPQYSLVLPDWELINGDGVWPGASSTSTAPLLCWYPTNLYHEDTISLDIPLKLKSSRSPTSPLTSDVLSNNIWVVVLTDRDDSQLQIDHQTYVYYTQN